MPFWKIDDKKISIAEFIKNWAEIVAIVVAAPWALYTFYFSNVFLPENEPPFLNISSIHTIEGEKASSYLIRTTVVIKNQGKIRTIIHAGSFNLTAFRIQPYFTTDDQYAKQVKNYVNAASEMPRFYEDTSSVINTGKLIEDGWRMDPGEEYSRSFLSVVPKKGFDAIRFYAEIYASRKSADELAIQWQVDSTGTINLALRKMPENVPLNNKKHASLIKKMGLGRSYDMEEVSLLSMTSGTKKVNTNIKE